MTSNLSLTGPLNWTGHKQEFSACLAFKCTRSDMSRIGWRILWLITWRITISHKVLFDSQTKSHMAFSNPKWLWLIIPQLYRWFRGPHTLPDPIGEVHPGSLHSVTKIIEPVTQPYQFCKWTASGKLSPICSRQFLWRVNFKPKSESLPEKGYKPHPRQRALDTHDHDPWY